MRTRGTGTEPGCAIAAAGAARSHANKAMEVGMAFTISLFCALSALPAAWSGAGKARGGWGRVGRPAMPPSLTRGFPAVLASRGGRANSAFQALYGSRACLGN